ncbi:MAG TPA: hypothetical protein VL358_04605 [Caulobacteraceae bacterium]|jgi:hypothetical protein|nr:hypothetical protein [Caulobacteraceae bacterium]
MKIVQFVRYSPPYNVGETAGFEVHARADALIKSGHARAVDRKQANPPAANPAKVKAPGKAAAAAAAKGATTQTDPA